MRPLRLLLAAGALLAAGPAAAQQTATLVGTGGDETTVGLSYTQHRAGTGRPYGQFTVDYTYPSGWTPATDSSGVAGCLQNVSAHIDATSCEVISANTIRLALTDFDRNTAFPTLPLIGTITFSGTGGSINAGAFGIAVVDARDDRGNLDNGNFQTQVDSCNFSSVLERTVSDVILGTNDEITACVQITIGPNVDVQADIGVVAGQAVRIRPELRVGQGDIFAVQTNP